MLESGKVGSGRVEGAEGAKICLRSGGGAEGAKSSSLVRGEEPIEKRACAREISLKRQRKINKNYYLLKKFNLSAGFTRFLASSFISEAISFKLFDILNNFREASRVRSDQC